MYREKHVFVASIAVSLTMGWFERRYNNKKSRLEFKQVDIPIPESTVIFMMFCYFYVFLSLILFKTE